MELKPVWGIFFSTNISALWAFSKINFLPPRSIFIAQGFLIFFPELIFLYKIPVCKNINDKDRRQEQS